MNRKIKATIILVSLLSVFTLIALSERADRLEQQRQVEFKAQFEKIEKEKLEEKEIKKELIRLSHMSGLCHPGIAVVQLTGQRLSTRLKEIKDARLAFEGPEPKKVSPESTSIEFISRRDNE